MAYDVRMSMLTDPEFVLAAAEAFAVKRSPWWLGRYRKAPTAHLRPSEPNPRLGWVADTTVVDEPPVSDATTVTGLGWPVGSGRAR